MCTMKKTYLIILLSIVLCVGTSKADDQLIFNPIQTAVPSLAISPESRGAGMGDIGAATTPDVNSQHWNPSKYAFLESKAGVGLSYTPWLRKLVNDIALMYLTGYYKIGDLQTMSASLRYFSLGEVTIRESSDATGYTINPYEMALDLAYSRKLSDKFSAAVALRFIYSDMTYGGDNEITPGSAFAADIAMYYNNYVFVGNSECLWSWGANISNIGSKISYDQGNNSSFIPTNLRLGTSLLYPIDEYNRIAFSADVNKLLVPTPPIGSYTVDDDGNATITDDAAWEDYKNMSPISGIFKSFSDAPGGFSEELKEINWSIGAEYIYDQRFFLRGGYYHESAIKGNRKYYTFGAGFKMNIFQLDAAYMIAAAQQSPLDQTLRFSLSFDMEGLKTIMRR